jgi:hypothetical protein
MPIDLRAVSHGVKKKRQRKKRAAMAERVSARKRKKGPFYLR